MSDDADDWVARQDEALAYARSHPDKNMGAALEFAIGLAVRSLLGEEQRFYLTECLPEKKLDFLLYVRLVGHLLERRERVGRIFSGDHADDWLPPELGALLEKK